MSITDVQSRIEDRPEAKAPGGVSGWTLLSKPGVPILIFLIVLVAVLSVASNRFLTTSNVFAIANQSVFIVILAVGMTIVMIGGGIDLSVGSILAVSGGVVAYLVNDGVMLGTAFVVALVVGTALGVINGLVITRLGVPDFIATLAMMGVARGALYVWTNAVPFRDYMLPTYYEVGGLNPIWGRVTVPILMALAVALVGGLLLRRTVFGRRVRGAGSNLEAARLSGIGIDRLKVLVYALSGLLAAVTGIMLAGRLTTVQPELGSGYELTAIAAAVMGGAALSGGRGSILGALVGAVTLAVIQNALNILNIDPYWQTIITGAVILAAVLVARLGSGTTRADHA